MSGVANHERPFNRAYFFIRIIKTDKIQTTTKKIPYSKFLLVYIHISNNKIKYYTIYFSIFLPY